MRNVVQSTVEFAKNLTLGKDERLLRETGMKDECGVYTQDAKEIVINKLVGENKDVLLEIAGEIKKEQEKNL